MFEKYIFNGENFRRWVSVTITIFAIIVIGSGYWKSISEVRLQQDNRSTATILLERLTREYPDQKAERIVANKYWLKYRDVRVDGMYGDGGHLGVYGARQHYLLHGRNEGRTWPVP